MTDDASLNHAVRCYHYDDLPDIVEIDASAETAPTEVNRAHTLWLALEAVPNEARDGEVREWPPRLSPTASGTA